LVGHDAGGAAGSNDAVRIGPDEAVRARRAGGSTGSGVADAEGRLLWVDQAFCRIAGRPRAALVGADFAEVLALDPEITAGAVPDRGLVRLPGESGASAVWVAPLGPQGAPSAYVIELPGDRASLESTPADSRPPVAVFTLDWYGNLTGGWGAAEDLAVFGAGALSEPPGGAVPFSELVRRSLDGVSSAGLVLVEGIPWEVHLFPVGPNYDGGAVVGVVTVLPARRFPAVPGPKDRQAALADLARYALRGAGRALLLDEAVRLVHGALDSEVSLFEYVPDPAWRLRGPAFFPSGPPVVATTATAASYRAGTPDPSGRSLAVTIEGSPAVGVLAVYLGPDRRFDAEEAAFVSDAADIVAVALRRMAGDEHQYRAALHDPLTGLPNRALILDHLGLALARAERQPSPVAVLFIDLVGFKLVNDTLGHDVGDALLVAVAERLFGLLRPADTLGRLGGDEFLVVCGDLAGEAEARAVAGRLASAFERPFPLEGRDVHAAASIGLSLSRRGTSPASLLAEADAAMYEAKMFGGAPVAYRTRMRRDPETGTGGEALGPAPHAALVAPLLGGHLQGLLSRLAEMVEAVGEAGPLDGDARDN